jgi:hypothetical protein
LPAQRRASLAPGENDRRGLRKFRIEVSEDDLRAIAKRGYEGAVTTDHDQQAEAVGLLLTDVLLQIRPSRPLLRRSACSSAIRLPASTTCGDAVTQRRCIAA